MSSLWFWPPRTTLFLFILIVVTSVTGSLSAQGIRGKVAEIDIAEPVSGASVWLLGLEGEVYGVAFTDSSGTFDLRAPVAGWYLIRAHHMRYLSSAIEIQLQEGVIIEVRVNLRPRPGIRLDPIVVTARQLTKGQQEFTSRLNRRWGKQVMQEELLESAAGNLETFLNWWANYESRGCRRYYLDGRRVNPTYAGAEVLASWVLQYPLDWIYGLEVYRTQDDAPMQYRERMGAASRCAVVLIWTTTIGSSN